nr:esterase/lipase [uncultured archaeon]
MFLDINISGNFARIYVENTVLLCHGLPAEPGSVVEKGYDKLARYFARYFTPVIFDFSGCGLSRKEFSLRRWVEDLINIAGSFSHVDIVAFSMGGVPAVYTAANLRNVRSVTLVATPCCFDVLSLKILQEVHANAKTRGTLRVGDFSSFVMGLKEDMMEFEPLRWIEKVKNVLLVHGTKDDVVPLESSEKLFRFAKSPKKLLKVIGGGHKLRQEKAVVDKIIEWITGEKKKESVEIIP